MKPESKKGTRIKNKLSVLFLGLFVLVTLTGFNLAGPRDSYGLDFYLPDDYVTYLYPLPNDKLYYHISRKVAIYTDEGTNSESILAVFRAVAAMGHSVYGIGKSDIEHGRLNTNNFDVLILPPAESGSAWSYYSAFSGTNANNNIKTFVNNGGGFVGIGAGAHYASTYYSYYLGLYGGSYTGWSGSGKFSFDIVDPTFGSGSQEAYMSTGGGHFPWSGVSVSGATAVVENYYNNPVAIRDEYGAGRVILISIELSLLGDSLLDWTIWDNWEMGSHANSEGAWKLLGRMIDWAAGGSATEPNIFTSNPGGDYVAVITTHTSDGGASPKLIPAVGRSIEYAGHMPLAIRFKDVKNNQLTITNFDAVVFPGGYAYGYKTGLSGHESKVLNFISNGGGYLGICAGSYYAADYIFWDGSWYDYPLNLYAGYDIGPISAIAGLDGDNNLTYALTPITINDPVIGNLGTQQQLYYGGGYKWSYGGQATVATYNAYYGKADAVRFTYGAGHVLLVGTHPEALAGSNEDWLYWDNYEYNSNTPVSNPDNPWEFIDAIFNNWLTY